MALDKYNKDKLSLFAYYNPFPLVNVKELASVLILLAGRVDLWLSVVWSELWIIP